MRLIMNKGQRHTIYGKVVNAGDEFEVPEVEAKAWVLLGMAKEKEIVEDPKPRRGRYNRSDLRAENESRADLRSEDDE
jgi:hypothetical protein